MKRTLSLRKAGMRDIPAVLALINGYAANGIMLPRTEFDLSENIRDFSVAFDGHVLVGCGALHFYTPSVGEVRSLAVLPEAKQNGIGRIVVEALQAEALEYDLEAIFAFTYVPQFFAKLGFSEVERGELPLKVWRDCLRGCRRKYFLPSVADTGRGRWFRLECACTGLEVMVKRSEAVLLAAESVK